MSFFKKKEKPILKTMGKTERFFKRLPFTTFFNPEFIGNTLDKRLIRNVVSRDLEFAKKAIEMGADVNARDEKGKTCLMLACELQNFEMISLLVNEYAKIDIKNKINGMTALHYACVQPDLRIVNLLINHENVKKRLLKRVNKRDNEGNTPLMVAVKNNNYFTVQRLLQLGANKNIKNIQKETAFTIAENMKAYKLTLLLRQF